MGRLLLIACTLIVTLGISSCATSSVARPSVCPVLPPPPASVMVKRPPSFLERIKTFLYDSPAKPTPSPTSSQPARR